MLRVEFDSHLSLEGGEEHLAVETWRPREKDILGLHGAGDYDRE